jgi:hypothetical protein
MPINAPPTPVPVPAILSFDERLGLVRINSVTGNQPGSIPGTVIPRTQCYLTATIDGEVKPFEDSRQKFEELSRSWNDWNLGKSVIDYHDFAFEQIVGMGADAVPFLLKKLAAGESEWIYALKCITGQQADTEEMVGDEDRVVDAWIRWGKDNVRNG